LSESRAAASPDAALYQENAFKPVREAMIKCQPHGAARAVLAMDVLQAPKPLTLLYDDIERLWASIDRDDDWSGFEQHLKKTDRLRLATAPFFVGQPHPWPLSD